MTGVSPIKLSGLDLTTLDRIAEIMVRELACPQVIGLVGTLGAGKTTFVQAIARAAAIDDADVTSPTFTLLQTHRGTITLHHLDAYRVTDEDEFLELGVEELYEDGEAWTVVEWAERVAGVLPVDTLWIEIDIESRDRRGVSLAPATPRQRIALQTLRVES